MSRDTNFEFAYWIRYSECEQNEKHVFWMIEKISICMQQIHGHFVIWMNTEYSKWSAFHYLIECSKMEHCWRIWIVNIFNMLSRDLFARFVQIWIEKLFETSSAETWKLKLIVVHFLGFRVNHISHPFIHIHVMSMREMYPNSNRGFCEWLKINVFANRPRK